MTDLDPFILIQQDSSYTSCLPLPTEASFPNPVTPKAGFHLFSPNTNPPLQEPCLLLQGNRVCGQSPRPGNVYPEGTTRGRLGAMELPARARSCGDSGSISPR